MHCPNCGKQSSSNQKFCRSCGMSLEIVAKVVLEHLSVADAGKEKSQTNEDLALRRMYRLLLWGVIVILFGVGLITIGKRNDLITIPGALLSLVGMLLACYGVLSPLKTLYSRQSSQPEALPQSQSDLHLPPQSFFGPVSSVTDRTTELLNVKNAREPEKSSS